MNFSLSLFNRKLSIASVWILLSLVPALDSGMGGDEGEASAKKPAAKHVPLPARNSSTTAYRDPYSGITVANKDMAWSLMSHRENNAPRVGELAPNFALKTAEGDRTVSLKSLYQTKPVVLILSSWGCDIFRETLAGLQSLYTDYSSQAHFVMVYIREAHPANGFGAGLSRVTDPVTSEERAAVAA